MTNEQQLITYLFVKGEPVTKREILSYFKWDEAALSTALSSATNLVAQLSLSIVDDGKELELRTASGAQPLVDEIRKDDLGRDIGKAGLETLAIVLYKGAVSRAEIDYIRGVNSSHILRSLAMRGLVRRVPKPSDDRSYLYEPTTELLGHLGASRIEDLPDYAAIRANLAALEASATETPEEPPTDHAA